MVGAWHLLNVFFQHTCIHIKYHKYTAVESLSKFRGGNGSFQYIEWCIFVKYNVTATHIYNSNSDWHKSHTTKY